MFKYHEIQQPQIKLEKEIMNYFQSSLIEDGCIW